MVLRVRYPLLGTPHVPSRQPMASTFARTLEAKPRMIFIDRADAGRQLAARLRHLYNRDVVVLGLPRGGVPVAAEGS